MAGRREDVEETARWEADKERRTRVLAVDEYAQLIALAEQTCISLRRLGRAMDVGDFADGSLERLLADTIDGLVSALREVAS